MILKKLDVSRAVCDHLLSENHKESHRMTVGIIVVFAGVAISKIHTPFTIVHLMLDAGGYFIHAIGSIPFIEHISNTLKEKKEEVNNESKQS